VNKAEDRIKTLTEAWQDAEDRAMDREKRIKELESEDWCRTALEYQEKIKELEAAIFDVLCGEENEVVKNLILDQGCDEVACGYLHTCDHCPIVTNEMEST
jgi:hypothetical protein